MSPVSLLFLIWLLENLKRGLHYISIGQHWPGGQKEADIKRFFDLIKTQREEKKPRSPQGGPWQRGYQVCWGSGTWEPGLRCLL